MGLVIDPVLDTDSQHFKQFWYEGHPDEELRMRLESQEEYEKFGQHHDPVGVQHVVTVFSTDDEGTEEVDGLLDGTTQVRDLALGTQLDFLTHVGDAWDDSYSSQ